MEDIGVKFPERMSFAVPEESARAFMAFIDPLVTGEEMCVFGFSRMGFHILFRIGCPADTADDIQNRLETWRKQ